MSSTFPCSILSSFSPPVSHPLLPSLPVPAPAAPRSSKRPSRDGSVIAASGRGDAYGDEWSVDEDMIVLRKRLKEMRAAEKYHDEPPSHWMGWEKRCHASYGADVCRFVGLLQMYLMNTRPSVALGLLALVAMSVPASAAVVAINLVEGIKAALGGHHLG